MVLAELAGGIAKRLERLRDGHVLRLQADRRPRNANLQQARAQADFTRDESGSSRRAAVLAVVVGEHHAFLGDSVDVGRAIAHHTVAVGADIGLADVIAEDDENVGLLAGGRGRRQRGRRRRGNRRVGRHRRILPGRRWLGRYRRRRGRLCRRLLFLGRRLLLAAARDREHGGGHGQHHQPGAPPFPYAFFNSVHVPPPFIDPLRSVHCCSHRAHGLPAG
ncbi:hypothetical protein D3C81_1009580 [compost metagenome]